MTTIKTGLLSVSLMLFSGIFMQAHARMSDAEMRACDDEVASFKKMLATSPESPDVKRKALGMHIRNVFGFQCRNHPQAQQRLAEAKALMNGNAGVSQKTKPAKTPSPRKEPRYHVNDAVATKCLTLDKRPGYGGFVNSCSFAVEYHYCAFRPGKDSWLKNYNCERNQGGAGVVGPKKTDGAHTKNAERIYWVACRYRGPDGKRTGISPMDIKWDHQKRTLRFRCGEWGSGRSR